MASAFQILMMTLVAGTFSAAQDSSSPDRTLSQLRGNWEAHTFRDKWTLFFENDRSINFDRNPAGYSLRPGTIRIQDGDGETDYPYTLTGDELTLKLPDGSERTYRKSDPGESERLVHGTFFESSDGTPLADRITFDGLNSFELQSTVRETSGQAQGVPGDGNSPNRITVERGLYRVEGNAVILAFDDGTIDQTLIRSREDDGSVASVAFGDRLFALDEPLALLPTSDLPLGSPPQPVPPDPQPVPPYPFPCPPPQPPPPAMAASGGSDSKPAAKPADQHRDFGSTRGGGGR
jgi:hypothetical protein